MEELFKFFQTAIDIPYDVTVKEDTYPHKIVGNFYKDRKSFLCVQIVSQVILHYYGGPASNVKYFLKISFEVKPSLWEREKCWEIIDYLMDESILRPDTVLTTNNKGDVSVVYEVPINNLGFLRKRLTLNGLKQNKTLKRFDL